MRFWVPTAVAGLVISGCGGSGAPATNQSAGTGDKPAVAAAGTAACDVVTKADAAAALGRDVEQLPADRGPAGLDMCQYGYQGERMTDSGQATVTVHPVDLASLKRGIADQGFKTEPVPGLGDAAFWSEEAGLYVGKGNRSATYLVGIGGADPAANKQKAIELAKATIARL